MRIDACFDSHVHWAATGEFHQRLRLDHLHAPSEVRELRPEKIHFRGEWLIGFGWDENKWTERPHRRHLDEWFPHTPVALTRCDGHGLWCNTEALRRAGLMDQSIAEGKGGRIERDQLGQPTGILIDQAMDIVDKLIPEPTAFEIRRQLLEAVKIFNDAGYTHIRDMTCNERQWNESLKLDRTGLLTLAVEEYFWLKSSADLDKTLDFMVRAGKESPGNIRLKGIKVFLDGALGSEGAWLSHHYCGSTHHGLQLWEAHELKETIAKIWEKGFEVACHAIGDEAVHLVTTLASELITSGRQGKLHIEHGEIIRPETIEKMKGLNIEVHLQPSHWLSDQRWLKEKVGPLFEYAFPWRKLQEADIPFDFGSDSPIEPTSIGRIFAAIRESAQAGIPRLLGLPSSYVGHRDLSWAPNSFTLLEEESPVQVVFRGEHLL